MLLQALVMSVILSMISVMVIRWVFSRYVVANQFQNSARNTSISTGYAMSNSSRWIIPNADANTTLDGKAVVFHFLSAGTYTTTVTDIPF